MLNIYIDKSNLPKDRVFVNDVDAFFNACKLRNTDFTKFVLHEIEKGEYVDEDIFTDRFGRGLFINCLSTGAKILLSAQYFPDMVFNCCEAGNNVLELLLLCADANIYFPNGNREFETFNDKIEIYVNGVKAESLSRLNDLIYFGDDE